MSSDEQRIEIGVEKLTPTQADLEKAEDSTQLQERRIRARAGLGIRPPYNPDRLAAFLELNETHAAAVRKKARYEVGFGFDIVAHDSVEDADAASDDERETVEDFWHSPDSTWQTGPQQSAEPTTPTEILELARQDYHAIGWACIEILVNNAGEPTGLAHVPANTVRVRKPTADEDLDSEPVIADDIDGQQRGYVQERQGRRRYFGEAGDRYEDTPVFVDAENGDVVTESAENLDNTPANELIFIRNPSPLADHYGIPDWISALRTISSDEAAKDYNRQFFDNDTIPRLVVKVTGGELTEESKRDLRQMVHGLREESHRTVVLETEKFASQLDEDVEIELEPLGQGITEEMSFEAFREKNEHDIAKAHEVPPILIGVTETSNRSNSDVQEHEFAVNKIGPEQHKIEERLYQILHQQALGVEDWTIDFELRGGDRPAEDAKLAEQRVRAMRLAGVATVNEAREELGLKPFDDERGEMTLAEFEAEFQGGGGDGDVEQAGDDRPDFLPPTDNRVGTRQGLELDADKDPIETQQFDSTNLDQAVYDFGQNELFVRFDRADGTDSLYVYLDVPEEEWQGLVNASSHGGYHYDNIRLEYPYEEITSNHERLPAGPSAPAPDELPEGL